MVVDVRLEGGGGGHAWAPAYWYRNDVLLVVNYIFLCKFIRSVIAKMFNVCNQSFNELQLSH